MKNMITAPEPLAVEEGAKVLAAGGNAVDAAVTSAFVQAVVNPQMCGLGGYAVCNLQLATGESVMLDAPALAGSKVTPTMWEDIVIGPNPFGWGYFLEGKVNDQGYQAICVPGWVKGLSTILARWGTMSWAQAMQPAIRFAEEGFMVDALLAARWQRQPLYQEDSTLLDYITNNPEASRVYLKADGKPYSAGETLRNPDYAQTLRHLAKKGAEDFYQGQLAERMAADLADNDSFVVAQDLKEYQIRLDAPVVSSYRGFKVTSARPPHGGPTLLAILNILEGYDLVSLGHNSPDYIYLVAMAMKAAFADRNPYMGDAAFVDVPLEWMTSKERAAEWRDKIDAGEPIHVTFTPPEAPDTTQVSVVDQAGNCVSLTHSLGASSGVITPGLGFMYNNSMVNFHPWSGHPNSILPGKARTTGMAPTIVYQENQENKPRLVLGSPGATRIITANVQVILNVLDFGMSPSQAILAPRFDCQGDLIKCQTRIPEYVCAQVRRKHPITRLPQSHGSFALVHAIAIDPVTGQLTGGADTGSGGMALGV
ncbi:MAG: gamma-glutamyltransferase [Ardenticatenaceae bacterium]